MNSLRGTFTRIVIAGLLLGLTGGCAAPMRVFVNNQADMTLYQKVVVVPFGNLSGDPFAGNRITRAFTTELVIADRFQFVDPAQLMGELDKTGGLPDAYGNIDAVKLRDAATKLQATAWIRGAVTEYSLVHTPTSEYPVVSFDVEMVDVASGNVVWRVSVTESGKGRVPVVGGAGERTFGRVTQEACQRAVALLRARAF